MVQVLLPWCFLIFVPSWNLSTTIIPAKYNIIVKLISVSFRETCLSQRMLNQLGIIKVNVGSNSGVILWVEFMYFNNLFTHCFVNFIGYCVLLEFFLALASRNIRNSYIMPIESLSV